MTFPCLPLSAPAITITRSPFLMEGFAFGGRAFVFLLLIVDNYGKSFFIKVLQVPVTRSSYNHALSVPLLPGQISWCREVRQLHLTKQLRCHRSVYRNRLCDGSLF